MAQPSSPILPIPSGIGAVSPVNVGGPGSAEEAFRRQQGVLQRLLSGLGGGNNVSIEDLARSQFRDRQDLMTGLESAGSSRSGSGQSIDITGQNNQILPPGFSSTDLTPIPGSIGMSEVPVTGAPNLNTAQSGLQRGPLGLDMTAMDNNPLSISAPMPSDEANRLAALFGITPKGQQSFSDLISGIGRITAPRETPRERKERAAKGEAFRRSEDAIGGTLFGDAVDVTPAEAQETAGILTDLISGSASRGGAETAATDGKESGTNVQGDVTDITDQPDDLVETDPRFGAETATGSGETTQSSESMGPFQDLMKAAFDSYSDAVGRAPSGAKTMEEYKKEFSDATGIDITGQPDNSAALTAFGLALMQNKAGKEFDVGEILSETGEAGEKALPLMAEARKEARQGQFAAGQYALTQAQSADASRQQFLVDQANYLRDRQDKILDYAQLRRDKLTDDRSKRFHDRQMEALRHGFKVKQKEIQANIDAAKDDGYDKIEDHQLLPNITALKVKRGFDGKNPVYADPGTTASQVGEAYADVQVKLAMVDDLEDILTKLANEGDQAFGGQIGKIVFDRINMYSKLWGGPYANVFSERGLTAESEAQVIIDAFVQANKRFISQETGNGVSDGDKKDIRTVTGEIVIGESLDKNLLRLEEVRSLFSKNVGLLEGELVRLGDRTEYSSDEQYEKAQKILSSILNPIDILGTTSFDVRS